MTKSRLTLIPHTAQRIQVKNVFRTVALGALLFSGLLAMMDSTEPPKVCSACTYIIDGPDNSTLNLSGGEVICITESGEFTGTINRWNGTTDIQICNEGIFNPAQVNLNAGSNQIDNYGSMAAGTINIYNSVSSANLTNHDGANMTVSTFNLQGANSVANISGTFDASNFTVNNGAQVQINEGVEVDFSGFTMNSGTLINEGTIDLKDKTLSINANTDIRNYGILKGIQHLNINSQGKLQNWGEVLARLHVNVNDTIQNYSGKIEVGGHLTINSSGVLYTEAGLTVSRNMTLNGTIEGPIAGNYGWLEVDGKTTINSSGVIVGRIDVCDSGNPSNGFDKNSGTVSTSVTNCVNNGNTAMPVELLDFQAELQGNGVELIWFTAIELNNDYFTIERSADGKAFTAIGEVKGAGTTESMQSYSFRDPSPLIDRNYYRLKQTDYDGSAAYSSLIEISTPKLKVDIESYAYPNPTTGQSTLAINCGEGLRGDLSIVGITGQVVSSMPLDLSAGSHRLPIDLSAAASGIYFINVNNSWPQKFPTVRIVKQ